MKVPAENKNTAKRHMNPGAGLPLCPGADYKKENEKPGREEKTGVMQRLHRDEAILSQKTDICDNYGRRKTRE
ncbi:hypothetical protein [Methanoplanus limicola]|uniref:Uncharacterized protein n=1 Tax=Methanoplanus limicola DSM 2279 TaxID=937775 RepID=H1Z2H5_9EURY|nr:hypothetical protein [Methanoplanus limicola]EHQ35501.1 hypothetical protein Metlim_1395 [Methanoplanus limicola DSM 2279]